MKLEIISDFLTYEATMIDKHHKFIQEKGLFEESSYEFD
jgi:hypothetical protein